MITSGNSRKLVYQFTMGVGNGSLDKVAKRMARVQT